MKNVYLFREKNKVHLLQRIFCTYRNVYVLATKLTRNLVFLRVAQYRGRERFFIATSNETRKRKSLLQIEGSVSFSLQKSRRIHSCETYSSLSTEYLLCGKSHGYSNLNAIKDAEEHFDNEFLSYRLYAGSWLAKSDLFRLYPVTSIDQIYKRYANQQSIIYKKNHTTVHTFAYFK